MLLSLNIILTLTTGEWIGIAAIVLPVLGSLLVLIFKSGGLFSKIDFIKDSISEIKSDVKVIPVIEDRVGVLWTERFTKTSSPKILNDKGLKILKDSKIEELTDKHYDEIISQVRDLDPKNAYQAQELLILVVRNFKNNEECKNKLENAAYISGIDVDTLLLVAAINIRDKVVNELNFNIEDIDKHDPRKKKD